MSASRVYLLMSGLTTLACSIMFGTYAVYYVQALGLNPLQLVLVGTVLEATIMLLELPTGVVADSYSRRLSVIIGMFVLGGAYLLEGSLTFLLPGALFVGVLLAEAIRGVGETFLSGAVDAWIADEVGEEQLTAIYVKAGQINRVVSLVGLGLSIGLAMIKLWLPYLTGGIIYLALAVTLLLIMPETGFTPAPRGDRSPFRLMGDTFRSGIAVVRGRPLLMLMLAMGVVGGISSEGYDRLWEAHFLTTFTFPALGQLQPVVWFGIIGVAGTVLGFAVTALTGRWLEGLQGDRAARSLAWLTAGRVLLLAGFGLAPSFGWALAAFLAAGVVGSLWHPIYRAWIHESIDSGVRATVLSMMGLTDALGQSAGGPLVGAVGTRFSLRSAMVLTAGLLAPGVGLFARARRRPAATDQPAAETV